MIGAYLYVGLLEFMIKIISSNSICTTTFFNKTASHFVCQMEAVVSHEQML